MTTPPLVRPYRGTPAQDRVAQRRSALLDAALTVFETEGLGGLSARRVCEEARLTRRYFYESFEDIDTLTAALLERTTDEIRDAVQRASAAPDLPWPEATRRAISHGLDILLATPAKGRFLAAVHTAGGPVAQRRMKAVGELATLVEQLLASRTPASRHYDTTPLPAGQARAAAVAAVGAVLGLVDSWLSDELEATREELVTWASTIALAIFAGVAAPTDYPGSS
ncbi:TetR/AcrR family transcriptional regulator [Streptomyces californicus]|uniref:TetR/AcrR family transcriptional regulator n=1 Tax=Streptomyces californicus TaxID=67351 RepID=UPI00296EACC7|nr:TetR/AcrR family transcriptional regulator [Streptomyces californicus]MDW4918655.1 TetR/AcrR family transcriptional regulator [Streptomyces californicus]